MKRYCLGILAIVFLVGCTSVRSTFVHPGPSDDGWNKIGRSSGVPITLKVNSHLRVTIKEHHFLQMSNGDAISWVDLDVPVRSVESSWVPTETIITVDPKRPGAGTLTTSLGFTGQYFNKINYKNEDQTIQAITAAFSRLAESGIFSPASTPSTSDTSDIDSQLMETQSIVATTVLAIDDPTFELQLEDFLARHLNACHTCCVVAPGSGRAKILDLPGVCAAGCIESLPILAEEASEH